MKLKALAGLISCAALLGAPAAVQAQKLIPTQVIVDSDVAAGPGLEIVGHLTSPNPKCIRGRVIKIFFKYPGGTRLVDTAISSPQGVWAGGGNDTGLIHARITGTRKTFGRRGHRRTCGVNVQLDG